MAELVKKSKDKFYRGKNVAELKGVDIREFAKLVRARERRTLLRNYDVVGAFLNKCDVCDSKKKLIKTHDRALVIVPGMVGRTDHS